MKKRQQKVFLAGLLGLAVITGVALYVARQPTDRCTAADRQQINCVPAGRCTPPGDPREATIDCQITQYDHKFNTSR